MCHINRNVPILSIKTVINKQIALITLKSLNVNHHKYAIFFYLVCCFIFSDNTTSLARKGNQGCCSRHGGVAYCDHSTGSIICRDGTISPSCGCDKTVEAGDSIAPNNHGHETYPKYNFLDSNNYRPYSRPPTDTHSTEKKEYEKSTWFLLSLTVGYEKYFVINQNEPSDVAFSEIKTQVKPIDLAYVQLNASIPFLFFEAIYKYKYTTGGYIRDDEKNEHIKNLVDDKKLQYFLTVAAGLIGFELGYTRQHFDFGTYDYYRSAETPDEYNLEFSRTRDLFIGKSYFEIDKQQLDIKYHLWWFNIPQLGGVKKSEYGIDLFLGYRYLEYESPGIVYTYTFDEEILCGESLPQQIVHRIHMGGIGINNYNMPLSFGMNLLLGIETYLGYGYAKANINDFWYEPLYFPADYNPANDLNRNIELLSLEIGGSIGLALCLSNGLFITNIKVEWCFELYTNMGLEGEQYMYDTGESAFDLFHSLKASGTITF